jgi:hypothetical protein
MIEGEIDEEAMIRDLVARMSKFREIERIYIEKRRAEIYDSTWEKVRTTRYEYGIDIIVDVVDQQVWDKIVDVEGEFERAHPGPYYGYQIIERVGEPLETVYDSTDRRLVYNAAESRAKPQKLKKVKKVKR